MHALLSFVQFKKHEKDPWRSDTFSKITGFSMGNTSPWVFSRFLNYANGTKSRNTSYNDIKFLLFFTEPFELTNTARAVYDLGKFMRIKEEFKRVCINV